MNRRGFVAALAAIASGAVIDREKLSGFPESVNSQRQAMERLVALLAPTPLGMEIMGSPDNAAALVRLSGSKRQNKEL